jgi:hypothetical protein
MSRKHSLTLGFVFRGVVHEWQISIHKLEVWLFLAFLTGILCVFHAFRTHNAVTLWLGFIMSMVSLLVSRKLNKDLEADRQAWIREISGKDSE